MATSESPNKIVDPLLNIKEHSGKTIFSVIVKKYNNKRDLFILCSFHSKGYPPFPKLDFGLGARVFSVVLTHLEPTILFSHCSAVSHSKPRDFRLHEPRSFFFHWSAVSPLKNNTEGGGVGKLLSHQNEAYLDIWAQFTTPLHLPCKES